MSARSSIAQHGRMPDGKAAVVAMGKLGGEEMTAASDLDLITVYDYAGEDAKSDGDEVCLALNTTRGSRSA